MENFNIIKIRYREFLVKRKALNIDKKVNELIDYLNNPRINVAVSDELIDFFDNINQRPTRYDSFSRIIRNNYSNEIYKNILDIGCGVFADTSVILNKHSYNVTGLDPRVEENREIKTIKDNFDYTKFDVTQYDLLIGLEPCLATEHIIRSAIKYNKQFIISLCSAPHDSIDGKKFKTYLEWYKYLLEISGDYAHIIEKRVLGKNHTLIKNKE